MTNILLAIGVSIFGQAPKAEDAPALRLLKTVELPGKPGKLDHFAFDANTKRLFVANQGNASLDVIDVAAAKVVKQVPEQKRIQGIAFDPKSGRIFTGNGDPGECAVIDGKTYDVIKRLPVAKADNVQYDPHSGRIFVGGLALTAIDPARIAIEKELPTPGELKAFRIDPTKPRLYADAVSGDVCVFDTEALKSLGNYALAKVGGNAAMTIDPANRRLFIGCRKPPAMVVFDADSGKEVARLDLPPAVDDMWYDAAGKRIYASTGGGEVAVIAQESADRYLRLPGVAADKLAKTSFFDGASGMYFLGVPSSDPATMPTRILIYATRK